MPTLIDRGGVRKNCWTKIGAEALVQAGASASVGGEAGEPGTHRLLSLDQWMSHGEALLAAGTEVGIQLEPAEGPEAIAHLLDRIRLVAVHFPSFTDGRGYSTARLLRQRYGWKGELRAVGDVLRDQMFYLSRCGFDTFELKDGEDVEAALAAFADFTEAYQEAADRGPLFRRRQQPSGPDNPSGTITATAAR